ncbi:gfo/Idh/MocA family oxidoreductase [Halocatena pleomorpha]|uniref:Gfo/Idh/MocA family oxidoreductase n=2 Tax=Halocatena pleomorpha TaxID=1785090 RepID=A0A3P3R8K0_9EURY|nr:gfo/Idh/MocA family oxidoreductase [Halocatena pleomorpha]
MGYRHAEAYRDNDQCRLIACADIVRENAEAFATEFDLDPEGVYVDYETMLSDVEPDIVSVTVPPDVHETIVVDCANHDAVAAVHCEKPMAHTWPSAQRMVQTCWRNNTQLTFNRQRRFGRPFTEADQLLQNGEIGALQRVEIGWGDFFDTGAHTIDLAGMFAGDCPPRWVIAQLDYREEDIRFGAHQENQMWAQWQYANGVYGTLSTGKGASLVEGTLLLRGTDGTIRIDVDDGPMLELEQDGTRTAIDVGGETLHGTPADGDRFGSRLHTRAIEAVVDALRNDEESQLCGRIGLNTAEIIFAGYESVRRRKRVDLPLEVDDNPIEQMIESGALSPVSESNE